MLEKAAIISCADTFSFRISLSQLQLLKCFYLLYRIYCTLTYFFDIWNIATSYETSHTTFHMNIHRSEVWVLRQPQNGSLCSSSQNISTLKSDIIFCVEENIGIAIIPVQTYSVNRRCKPFGLCSWGFQLSF